MAETEISASQPEIRTNIADVGYVVLKTIGIWYLIAAIQNVVIQLGVIFQMIAMPVGDIPPYINFVLPPIVYGIVGTILVIYAKSISRRVFSANRDVNVGGHTLQIVAMISVGIGLYWLALAVDVFGVDVAKYIVRIAMLNRPDRPQTEVVPDFNKIQDLYRPMIYAVLGGVLFFRPA